MSDTDTIKALSLMLLDMKDEEDGLLETMHSIKTACILQVEEEWEVTKDKALSNATKRNAEVELRLSGDEEYVQRSERQAELHTLIQRNQIELDFQRREFQRQNGNAAISVELGQIADYFERKEAPLTPKDMKAYPKGRGRTPGIA